MKIIDIIKLTENPLQILERHKVPVHYVNHKNLYYEYSRLMREGHKKSNAITWLSDRFCMSESVIYNVVAKFDERVE
jgi:hypothetical protein